MHSYKLALSLLLASSTLSYAANVSPRALRNANSEKKHERRLDFDEDFSMAATVSGVGKAAVVPPSSVGVDPNIAGTEQLHPSHSTHLTPNDKQVVQDKLCTGPIGRLYGTEAYNDEFGYLQLPVTDPVDVSTISPQSWGEGASSLPGDDFVFFIDPYNGAFMKLSKATGAVLKNLPTVTFEGQLTGLEMDLTTGKLYGVSVVSCGSGSKLLEIDPSTGSATVIASLPNVPCAIALAINGHGNGFIHDIVDDSLHSVDLETGITTLIGPTGFNANFAQGMSYNPGDDTIYMGAYIGGSGAELRRVDTATGATTRVADINSSTGCRAEITFAAFETCGFHGGWESIWSTLEYLANKVLGYGK